jgi:thiamine-monophosphate kinase
MGRSETLGDLGEQRIIKELLRPRYSEQAGAFGDDCAWLGYTLRAGSQAVLVATTDPCPEPMAIMLGYQDLYYYGWLLGTINLSDLAAAGALPLGVLSSIILPSQTQVRDFVRLLDGLDECCASVGTHVIGGNLKEGSRVDLTATAIGVCERNPPLRRVGGRVGDRVGVVGDLGNFWAGVLSMQRGVSLSESQHASLMRNVLTPEPKVRVGQRLREQGLVSTAIDNSDGLFPSLRALAQANELGVEVDFSGVEFASDVKTVASALGVDPVRLALGWGDWQLVVTFSKDKRKRIEDVCALHSSSFYEIGSIVEGSEVLIRVGEVVGPLMALDSQRFTPGSWFSAGLGSYISMMLEAPLISGATR